MNITINNQNHTVNLRVHLLDNAKQLGLDIPSLCGLNQEGEKIPCGLCVIEVDGEIKRACETYPQRGMVIVTDNEQIRRLRKKALDKIMSDHYADCQAPCQTACPAGVDIQAYLYHIAQGDHQRAVEIIKQTLPMPLSIGRVCPAFCEVECRRSLVDDPIAIRQLKRHAADIDLKAQLTYVPPKKPQKSQSIAIVGAGPGGLTCGYYLSNEGYNVTVYEAMPKAGGWLRYGIPEYRLPKDILDKEIELMCANGMLIETEQKLGVHFSLSELTYRFDAVCLAVGASKAVRMRYHGSELEGCYLGVDYLKDYVTTQLFKTGKKIAVIGGGNTAIDCARTAVRTGAETTLIYRRTREEMPAEDYEIVEAEHEGVKFHFLTTPEENIADEHGRVKAVRFEKMKLGEPDDSGRRSPQRTGEFFEEPFDTVISAVSQLPDLTFLSTDMIELPLTVHATQNSNPETMYSGVENIFSIGDFRRGPATAIEAVADGRVAAQSIMRYFGGKLYAAPVKAFNAQKERKLSLVDKTHFNHYQKQQRIMMPALTSEQRQQCFSEVELGFNNNDAMAEAMRCLECGCQANTDCKLRDYATEYKAEADSELLAQKQKFVVDNSSEFIIFDANRCISCGQCVQACNEEAVHGVLSFMKNKDGTLKSSPEHRAGFGHVDKMGDSKCVQCGSCVQVCPTGALVDSRDRSQGRVEVLKQVSTICTYCGVGCKINLFVDEKLNKIAYVQGADSPVNQGMLCVKGRYGFDFIQSEQRLTTPLIRKNGVLVSATWDEAIALVANKFNQIKQLYGSDALAGFSSAKTTNEDNYSFQKLIRAEFGTNNIDHCARLCHATTVSGLEAALGSGAMTNDIPSIEHSDVIFIIGSDTTAAHPIIASHIKRVIKQKTARLIVADPKRIQMADYADLYVAHRPGTDVMLLNGLMRLIIQNNWQDNNYIANFCDGYISFKDEVMKPDYSPDKVELVTGIKVNDLLTMAKMIGTAKRTAVYYSMGITQHTTGHDNVRAIANLQMLCGNLGIEGGGINPLRGQSNVQGACDMGALPNSYPGYQKVYDNQVREKFEKVWNKENLPNEVGLTLTEIIDSICDDTIKGLYVMGENPALSDPDQDHVLHALDHIDFLVVQDIFLTETAKYADVVLPSFSFAEKTGHFTNTERRVQRLQPALKAPGQAREDWRIIQDIANAMGGQWNYESVQQITDEISTVTPQYAGITWARIGKNGLQWPCRDMNHEGTRIMHSQGIARGKGEMVPVCFRYAAEMPDLEFPLILSTGRLLEQFHTGTMTRKTKGLNNIAGPRVMISVEDAERLDIKNSEMVRVATRRGEIETPAFVTKRMQKGVIFIPFHFVEAPANRLTISAKDPHAKIPEFKVAAAKVEKIVVKEETFVS